MAYTYTGARNLYGDLTKDSSSTNLTLGDKLIIAGVRKIHGLKDWPFLYKERTLTSIASTQDYPFPYDTEKPLGVTVTVSSIIYHPIEVTSFAAWQKLNEQSSTYESNITQYWFAYNDRVSLYPISDTTAQTITIHSKLIVKDNSVADYTTGKIAAVTNGDGTVTGASAGDAPVWTTKMAGRYMRITDTDTAATGDGLWYEIASITSATVLELTRLYGGLTFTAATAAYTIGQWLQLPENYHTLPIYYAAYVYWSLQKDERANLFKGMYDEGVKAMISDYTNPTGTLSIDEDPDDGLNSNLFQRLGT